MATIEGRLIVGTYGGLRPVMSRKTGEAVPVPGMQEIVVMAGAMDHQFALRATFFNTDYEGETTRMRRMMDELQPREGECVAVRVSSKASKPNDKGVSYVNDEATAIYAVVVNETVLASGAADEAGR